MVHQLYFIIFIILISSCRIPEIPYHELPAAKSAGFNEGYSEGKSDGHQQGKQIGYHEGYKEGMQQVKLAQEQGVDEGYLKAKKEADSLCKSGKDYYTPSYISMAYFEKYGEPNRMIGAKSLLDKIEARVRTWVENEYDTMHIFKNGYNTGWKMALEGHLSVASSKLIHLDSDIRYDFPMVRYDSVIAKIKEIHQLHISSNFYPQKEVKLYGEALQIIHLDILDYIARLVRLTAREKQTMIQEYLKKQDDLKGMYYQNFRNIITSENIEYKNKYFYNFNTYYYSDAFIRTVRDGICGLSDAIFTIVKEDALFASVHGLDRMGEGHICTLVLEKVLAQIKVRMDRITLGSDYDANLPILETSVQDNLSKIVLETRKVLYPELITEKIYLKNGSESRVTIQMYVYVGLSVDKDLITHSLSDTGSFLTVNISEQPFILPNVFHIGYEVTNTDVNTQFEYTQPHYSLFEAFISIFKPKHSKKVVVKKSIEMNDAINDVFQRHQSKLDYATVTALVQKQPLNFDCMQKMLPILRKIFEPLLAIPTSHYVIRFRFRNHEETMRTF